MTVTRREPKIFIEVKRYEDLKGTDPLNPLKEYVGTYWTPVHDNNFGTPYEQWQRIDLKYLKILHANPEIKPDALAWIKQLEQNLKTRDQAIELARENMAKIIKNMKPSEGDCMTCDNWPDRKQHHEECPYSNLVDTLTALDNLLKGQK